ncbi:MAG TPA: peptidoglycan-binding protein [Solirubrobacteraceae bacterium]|nr:peptidoglycan-binding protein [Solirubrobacteraceae bacterium]
MPKTANPIRALVAAACASLMVAAPVAFGASTGGAAAPGVTVPTSVIGGTGSSATKPATTSSGKPTTPAATPSESAATTPKAGSRPPARKAAPAVAPVLTGARCVTLCAGSLAVHAGGTIVLRGRHFVAGATVVVFPRQPLGGRKGLFTGVVMRSSPQGFVVTVPASAHSGHIVLRGATGLRSAAFGPVRVLPPAPIALQSAVPASGTAFDGNGMWIWYMTKSDAGSIPAIAAQAKAAGITTLFIKSSDGSDNYWPQFTAALIAQFHALGLKVCGWQYVYGTHPAGEAQLGAQAVAAGADCLVIDAEAEYAGKYAAAQTYMQALRAAVGPNYPIGLASFPYVDYHESIPYSVFLGPGGAQFNTPQLYWHTIGSTADAAFAHTYHENRIYARPIMPLGETYGGTPPAEMTRFRQLSAAYGASGLSWWDWQETTTAGWAALDQPLAAPLATAPITVDTSLPLFSQGSKGDQIVWMQEHLAAAEPATPTTGIFDAATTAALEAFQTAKGIPPTGTTDIPTWAALLALSPVPVDWTTAAAPK